MNVNVQYGVLITMPEIVGVFKGGEITKWAVFKEKAYTLFLFFMIILCFVISLSAMSVLFSTVAWGHNDDIAEVRNHIHVGIGDSEEIISTGICSKCDSVGRSGSSCRVCFLRQEIDEIEAQRKDLETLKEKLDWVMNTIVQRNLDHTEASMTEMYQYSKEDDKFYPNLDITASREKK